MRNEYAMIGKFYQLIVIIVMNSDSSLRSLSQTVADTIRQMITQGILMPTERLSEAALSHQLNVSRNTLRESFRLLTQEGILVHQPNRGVCVALPDITAIIDIYRIRRLIEVDAIKNTYPMHPALSKMQEAVHHARESSKQHDWQRVGTANIEFHAAIVSLANSERLNKWYQTMAAELRLVFSHMNNPQQLHAPYIEQNAQLLLMLQAGQLEQAALTMDEYLQISERTVLAVYTRQKSA